MIPIIETINDKYLTWRTGFDKEQREFQAWCEDNIHAHAGSIRARIHGFKHIVEVDWHKIYGDCPMLGWYVRKEFKNEYSFRNRKLGDHAMVTSMRGEYDKEKIFEANELFGGDHVFVGTNNDEDAIMIALKYG